MNDEMIFMKAMHPQSSDLLGFITYKHNKHTGQGELQIANFNASLKPSHLRVGASTKRGDKSQAGQHGEELPALSERYDLENKYLDLIQQDTEAVDLSMNSSQLLEVYTPDFVGKLWDRLLFNAQMEHGQAVFFYCSKDSSKAEHIIANCLRKAPIAVRERLWRILTSDIVLRSPEEEQQYLFLKAKKTDVPKTDFARHVD
ncbi:MAG: hypothetical protein Q9165_008531, partial [Trypethelium subeluteriae]